MSDIFRGACFTFGGLIVMTVWTVCMVEFAQWKFNYKAEADDAALLKVGPGPGSSDADVRRYHELMNAMGE